MFPPRMDRKVQNRTGRAAHERLCLSHNSGVGNLRIPTGFRPRAQGWPTAPTLGRLRHTDQPQRGSRQDPARVRRNRVGVETRSGPISQGSSFLATLGLVPESRWDSANQTLQLVGHAQMGHAQIGRWGLIWMASNESLLLHLGRRQTVDAKILDAPCPAARVVCP